MILFADDTNILITGLNKTDIEEKIIQTSQVINKWFNNNCLALNLNKTQFLQFKLNYFALDNIQKPMINATEVKFLGLMLDDTTWKKHTEQLVHKLSSACYDLINLRPLLSQDTLKTVYYAYLHSLLS